MMYQKRLKKERKQRQHIQEQLEMELKRRQKIEEALKQSGAPQEILRIVTGNLLHKPHPVTSIKTALD